jgi:hypothetical protein
MHIHYGGCPREYSSTPWPSVHFAAWRLWDANVAWNELEPKKGDWHFDRLDSYVELAKAHNVDILLTLGKTPTWASARPTEASPYGQSGSAAEPQDIEDWKNYIRTVASRYKGKIRHYEIWNEPNLADFFSGTVRQMLTLAREAYKILKDIDPDVIVVSPSATAANGIPWLESYFSLGGTEYADIIGYHFYVFADPPEAMVPLIRTVKETMKRYGAGNKALWDTEAGWSKPKLFSSENEAAAYVVRAYILNWAAGVDQFYWYAWDNHCWVTLEMTGRDNRSLKPAAIAYSQIQKWLIGSRMIAIGQDTRGTWVAKIRRPGNYTGWILWNPNATLTFEIPKDWNITGKTDLMGTKTSIVTVKKVNIGPAPILLDNASTP